MKKKISKVVVSLLLAAIMLSLNFIPPMGVHAASSIKVQFYNVDTTSSVGNIKTNFKILNNGTTSIDLSTIKIRYYFTDLRSSFVFQADYSSVGASNVKGIFGSSGNGNRYLEISFSTTNVYLGMNQSVTVQGQFHEVYYVPLNQTDDYSFNSTSTNYVDWDKVTGYISGYKVWGTEPYSTDTVYLSDLTELDGTTNGWGPVEKDQSVGGLGSNDGGNININGKLYSKGLGCHAYSVIQYDLGGKYNRFLATVGLDDETDSGGTVVFQVWADGICVYDSGIVRNDSAEKNIDISVTGVSTLRLVVTNAGDNDDSDHADWAMARVITATEYLSNMKELPGAVNGWGPIEKDQSVGGLGSNDGISININGKVYSKGLGCHATSEVQYNLEGRYNKFQAIIGLDNEIAPNGTVVFQVWADGIRMYDSGIVANNTEGKRIDVSVTGVSTLKLVITNSGDNDDSDHADWAMASLTTYATNTNTPTSTPTKANTSTPTKANTSTPTKANTSTPTKANTSTPTSSPTPEIAYLSDMTELPGKVNGWGDIKKNQSCDGNSITINNTVYTKGLGCHAYSNIKYNLSGKYTRFLAIVGLDDEISPKGSVMFQVRADGVLIYNSKSIRNGMIENIDVDITGTSVLELTVTNSGDNDDSDHADWAMARVTTGTNPSIPEVTSELNILELYKILSVDITCSDIAAKDRDPINTYIPNQDTKDLASLRDSIDGEVIKCFDKSTNTQIICKGDGTAYIQLEFKKQTPVSEISAYLGAVEEQNMRIEGADAIGDFTSKGGTYQLLCSNTKNCDGEWVKSSFNTPIYKKLIRIYFNNVSRFSLIAVPEITVRCAEPRNQVPTKPLNLRVLSSDARTVTLSWEKSTDMTQVVGYEVYRNNIPIGRTSTNYYTDSILFTPSRITPNTSYTYTVRAINLISNYSQFSSSVVGSTTNSLALKKNYKAVVLFYDPIVKAGEYSYFDPKENVMKIKTVVSDQYLSDLYKGYIEDVLDISKVNEFVNRYEQGFYNNSNGTVCLDLEVKHVGEIFPNNNPDILDIRKCIEYMEQNILGCAKVADDYPYYPAAHGGANYVKAMMDNNIFEEVEKGMCDLVFVTTSFSQNGFMEDMMYGKNVFFPNGPTRELDCSKRVYTGMFVAMDNKKTKQVNLHTFGHYIENVFNNLISTGMPSATRTIQNSISMESVVDMYSQNKSLGANKMSEFDMFMSSDGYLSYGKYLTPYASGIGNIHNPPTGSKDYGYTNVASDFNNSENKFPFHLGDEYWFKKGTITFENGKVKLAETSDTYITAGAEKTETQPYNKPLYKPQLYNEYSFSSDVMIPQGSKLNSRAGLVFGVTKLDSTGNILNGYYASVSANPGKVTLTKIVNGVSNDIVNNYSIVEGMTYNMKIEKVDGKINVSINGVKVIDNYQILNYLNELPGALGYRAINTNAWFDNLNVEVKCLTVADQWYDFPNIDLINGAKRRITSQQEFSQDETIFMNWWMSRIPKNPGYSDLIDQNTGIKITKAILNNWWPYILDINRFDGKAIDFVITDFSIPNVYNPTCIALTNGYQIKWDTPPTNSKIKEVRLYRNDSLIYTQTDLSQKTVTFNDYPAVIGSYVYKIVTVSDINNIVNEESSPYVFNVNFNNEKYLSEMQWTGTPINGYGEIHKNKSVDGNTININGITYEKGIGCHANSEIKYNLGCQFKLFKSKIGLDEEVTPKGSIVFKVLADGVNIYTSPLIKNDTPVQDISLNVTNVNELTLIVTDGGDNGDFDHADWADARVAY